ncbi:MAG: alpha/beta hydrolase [Myxococcota bacterium]
MVLKGQFLERPTLIPVAGGLVLEGLSHRGERGPGVLVLPPPPVEGSGMDHVVGAELAFAASRAGHPTLRFNYRGVGGSQGQPSRQVEALLDDALAAHQLAVENSGNRPVLVAAIGASDAVAFKLASLVTLAGVALVNPSVVRPEDLSAFPALPFGVVLAEEDPSQDRGRWATALEARDGLLTVVPGATRTYQRNLPLVGKAVVSLLARLGG